MCLRSECRGFAHPSVGLCLLVDRRGGTGDGSLLPDSPPRLLPNTCSQLFICIGSSVETSLSPSLSESDSSVSFSDTSLSSTSPLARCGSRSREMLLSISSPVVCRGEGTFLSRRSPSTCLRPFLSSSSASPLVHCGYRCIKHRHESHVRGGQRPISLEYQINPPPQHI